MKQKIILPALLLIGAGIILYVVEKDPFDSWIGSYELIVSVDGQPHAISEEQVESGEGGFQGNLNIFRYQEYNLIDFMVTGPPYFTIIGGTFKLEAVGSKSVEFYYSDGWGNKGHGKLTRLNHNRYNLALTPLPNEDSDDPLRMRGLVLMGEYDFGKTGSTPYLEANPWSFGGLNSEMRQDILSNR